MRDLLESGQQWLASQLRQHAARPVVYRRGASEVTVPATIGRTLLKLSDGYGGVRMQWTDRDYLIRAADLVLGGHQTLPQRGDRIREVQGDKVYVYEVLAPSGEPEWRWSDVFRTTLRIHAKQIDASA